MAVETISAREGLGEESKPVLPAPTVTAFLGRTEKGPVNQPVAVDSFDAYRRVFGGHCACGFVSYAVQHYFLHGGDSAVVVRLANGARSAVIDVPAGGRALRLTARRPGGREHLRVSVDYDGCEAGHGRFNLVVQRLARPGSQLVEDQELFAGLSLDPADRRFVVDALEDSALVRVAGPLPTGRPDATAALRPGEPIPYVDATRAGSDGRELTDYDVVGSNREGTGLYALDRLERVDLLCIPPPPSRDLGSTAFVAAERYCRRRRSMLIWDPPWSWTSAEAAVHGAREAPASSRSALTYFPRLRPRGEGARFPSGLPACGAIAGLLAGSDRARGRRPVPPDTRLKASLTGTADIDDAQASLLVGLGINPLVRVQGGGVRMDGNVCLVPGRARSGNDARALHVRRSVLFVVGALERRTRWACARAGRPDTPAAVEAQAHAFLASLHEDGVLAGRRAARAFFARAYPVRGGDAPALRLRVGAALAGDGELDVFEIEYRQDGMRTREMPRIF